MTEEKDVEAFDLIEFNGAVIDLGDAMEETRQQFPGGDVPDCLYTFGTRWGCP